MAELMALSHSDDMVTFDYSNFDQHNFFAYLLISGYDYKERMVPPESAGGVSLPLNQYC